MMDGMIMMCVMLCKTKCVYQSNGICELNALIPEPLSANEPCVHFIPAAVAQLGLPHRYFEPGSNAYQPVQRLYQRDVQESDIF